jgi:transposase-like protein
VLVCALSVEHAPCRRTHAGTWCDGSDANEAAIKSYNEAHGTAIAIRQVKYSNNIVEQDHRAVKRLTCSMLGFRSFTAAQDTLVGIELIHMIKKRQQQRLEDMHK